MRTLLAMALMAYIYMNSLHADAMLWVMIPALFMAFFEDVITILGKARYHVGR